MDTNKILKADYLDIVFEGRNKTYGGYELRRQYPKRAIIATVSIVALAILLGIIPEILRAIGKKEPVVVASNKAPVKLKAPPPMDETKPPPPPPPPLAEPPPPVKPTVKFTPPIIAPNEEVKEDEKPPEMAKEEAVAGPTTAAGDPNGIDPGITAPGTGTGLPVETKPAEEEIFRYVEIQPEFGGNLSDYLTRNLNYPDADREEGNEGKTFVEFIVGKDGKVTSAKIARSSGFSRMDNEALRVVRSMPPWKPGKQNGQAVGSYFTLPITFKLE